MVNILWGAVIVQVKDSFARIIFADCPHAKVKLTNTPRAAMSGDSGMLWHHIPRHPAAPLVIVPLAQHLDNLIFLPPPDEPIRAAGFLFQHGRFIEMHFDGFGDEMDGGVFHVGLFMLMHPSSAEQ
jgi:hypothetical protein